MFRTATDVATDCAARRADVRQMLVERRREVLLEIQRRIRDVREEGSSHRHHITTSVETCDGEPEDDLAFAVIELKGQLLERINEAVRQCDEGTYGYCIRCGAMIASSRLAAMPFAVRCLDCQEIQEDELRRARESPQPGRNDRARETAGFSAVRQRNQEYSRASLDIGGL
jgi:DnaK suppressor protein